ncbi:Ger(x)C family spore germination protein [Virgibacillus ihumii]|uniref:Ger(x)C family spore germination protein n=1 Tax=Virgibacillus ihumii TaxID=2686091 RepID=UPI00157C20BF|nr:Ger(x)C family spore germination protein [Virgibacillus ihumii]
MVKSRLICLIIAGISVMLLAGCWDRVEIEQRGFVLGAAIDIAEEQTDDELQLTLTAQIVVPSGLGTPTGGGSKKKAYMNISATGHSLFAIERELAQKTSRSPYFQHLKMVIISEDVASKPNLFSSLMDFFIRDHEMRRGNRVIIMDGRPIEALEATSDNENIPTIYIESMMDNSFKNADVLTPLRVGKIHGYLVTEQSFVIPKIEMKGNRVKYEGGAVFNGGKNRVVGTLNSKELKGMNLITGKIQGGLIKTELNEHLTTTEILRTKSNMSITSLQQNNVKASIKIDLSGKVAETFSSIDVANKRNLEKLEMKTEQKITKLVERTVEKAQQDLHTDVLGVEQLLKQHHYDFWKKIKDNWDHGKNYFTNSDITVQVNVNIRATGGVDQTSD